jgi:hypothetical protein
VGISVAFRFENGEFSDWEEATWLETGLVSFRGWSHLWEYGEVTVVARDENGEGVVFRLKVDQQTLSHGANTVLKGSVAVGSGELSTQRSASGSATAQGGGRE